MPTPVEASLFNAIEAVVQTQKGHRYQVEVNSDPFEVRWVKASEIYEGTGDTMKMYAPRTSAQSEFRVVDMTEEEGQTPTQGGHSGYMAFYHGLPKGGLMQGDENDRGILDAARHQAERIEGYEVKRVTVIPED